MRKAPLFWILLLQLLINPIALAEEENTKPTPSYFELKPSLVVNLPSGGKYLRADIQLMTMDSERLADITLHAPALRHELILLFSSQDGETVKTPDGKEELRKQALDVIQKKMKELTRYSSVEELFFTAFFVQ
jgi:flagellar FliL protein